VAEEIQSPIKKILRLTFANGFVQIIMSVLTLILGFLLMPIFIKKMGLTLYGIWLIPGILAGQLDFLDLGLTDGLKRKLSIDLAKEDRVGAHRTVSGIICILLFLGVFSSLLLIIFAKPILILFNIEPEMIEMSLRFVRVSAISILLSWFFRVNHIILESSLNHRWSGVLTTIQGASITGMLIYAVSVGDNLAIFKLYEIAVLSIISLIGMIIIFKKVFPGFRFILDKKALSDIRSTASYSLGMFYSRLMTYIGLKKDSLILGIMLGPQAVAIYNVITKTFVALNQLVNRGISVLYTTTIHIHTQLDKKEMGQYYIYSIIIRSFLSIPSAVFAIIILDDFLLYWVGDEFLEYAVWGKLILILPIITVLGTIASIMRSLGFLKSLNILHTISSIVSLIISIILVEKFGIGGPIVGSVATLIITTTLITMLYTKQFTQISPVLIIKILAYILVFNILVVFPLHQYLFTSLIHFWQYILFFIFVYLSNFPLLLYFLKKTPETVHRLSFT